jgi:phenylpropionate dioxygenase-like ring-hydroxylating dioxygenase large terminal subunit
MDDIRTVISKASDEIRPDFVPASDYAADTLKREKEMMWPRVWQMACRLEEIPKVGDFVNYEIFDESILVTRTAPDAIKAYYNVCQHRGRRLRDEKHGHIGRTFHCRFHGWQWNLDGSIANVYARDDWKTCPLQDGDIALKEVKVGIWGGWIWINQDPDAEPLMDYLGAVPGALDPFEPENMRALWWKTIIAPVNWKVVCVAFNEGYHSSATHRSGINYTPCSMPAVAHGKHAMFYNAPSPMGEYKDENGAWKMPQGFAEYLYVNNAHIYRTLFALTLDPGMEVSKRLLELPQDASPEVVLAKMFEYYREEFDKRGVRYPEKLTFDAWAAGGTDWHIFPNSIILPSIDGALWYRVRPNGDDPDSCIFDIWSFGRFAPGEEPAVTQEVFQGFEAFRGQCEFLEEDFANMEAVHRGTKSKGWTGARTNPVQEVSVNNFHKVLRQYTRPEK